MKFLIYCEIFRLFINFYSYWLIYYFVLVYAQKNKSDFYLRLACFYYVSVIGSFICGSMIWSDYPLSSAPEVLEVPSLPLSDLTLDNLDLQKKAELETEMEAKKRLKTQSCIWIITTLVVYYVVFTYLK